MKKTLALLLCLTMLATAMTACTTAATPEATTPPEPTAEAAVPEVEPELEEPEEVKFEQPEGYPSKVIDFIAPAGAGSPADTWTRGLEQIIDLNGARTSVTNIAGAGQTLGIAEGAARGGDGYTIISFGPAGGWIRPVMNELTYSLSDFRGIAPLTDPAKPTILVAADSEIDSIDTLFEALRNGDRFTYSSAQVGSGSHIIMSGILDQLGATGVEHIAYVDANETAIALLGGHIDFAVLADSVGKGFVAEGQMRMLAVCAPVRMEDMPDVPAVSECGINGMEWFNAYMWVGMHKDTPDDIFNWVSQQVIEALNSQEWRDYLAKNNTSLTPGFPTLDEFDEALAQAAETYRLAVIAAGLAAAE